mmetsp:Transcript_23339/g.65094  ORF Transcript_23339/g.65094 Transcript_23339/m.65094 type:complete len:202 (-) Transcript_23339:171-776(-)
MPTLADMPETAAAIAAEFQRFDKEHCGTVGTDELERIFRTLQPEIWNDDARVTALMGVADRNGDGRVEYDDFLEWLSGGHEDDCMEVITNLTATFRKPKVGGPPAAGGLGDARPADELAQEVLSYVKDQVEAQYGAAISSLSAVSYKTQVVAGVNFFIKASIDSMEFVHLRIHRGLDSRCTLNALERGKSERDPVEFFEHR